MSKHTPGPWTLEEHGGAFYIFGPDMAMIADNDDEGGFVPREVVARVRGVGRGATVEEQQANGKLLAAAPKLLDACKFVLALFDKLEAETELGDPLLNVRRRYHLPYRVALTEAILDAEKGGVSG
jgi:hypothetical protein